MRAGIREAGQQGCSSIIGEPRNQQLWWLQPLQGPRLQLQLLQSCWRCKESHNQLSADQAAAPDATAGRHQHSTTQHSTGASVWGPPRPPRWPRGLLAGPVARASTAPEPPLSLLMAPFPTVCARHSAGQQATAPHSSRKTMAAAGAVSCLGHTELAAAPGPAAAPLCPCSFQQTSGHTPAPATAALLLPV